ncbi:HAD-IB family hydrolase (plasmid) [Mycobacterium paragordonae]|uniref:Acyltransferase n=1 Tax=Mycobacterium paragordonae TaxID=1389713 RepID=A0ABQ1CEI8_9MYCO|nr:MULTISPECIES: HAD-IB family hydrolase [Mycobacterium]AYE99358.1 HAD-IB family hydrolase [Mycobacterium paragordonae]RUP02731.1 MAG: HAD-IB family hydrolase [Mycobacterium sp.]GFG82881.1 acyltransferase [Mycobacterium paragordonae]
MTGSTPQMIAVEEVIADIKAGPDGRKVAAFFDFDGTLIQGYSAGALMAHRARNFELGPDEFVRTMLAALGGPLDEAAFKELMLQGIRGWVGRTEDELMELGQELFANDIAGALFHGTWRLVRAHQNKGHTVVIATSATRMQVEPMARELGIDHILCTELETEHGVLTGGIAGRPLWAEGKAAAVREFAKRERIPLKNCHAYANGNEDVPFLEAVGFPHPVNPGSELARHAGERGWPIIRFRTKRSQFHPLAMARTTGLFGGFAAAVGAGTILGLLTNDSRGGVDLTTSLFGRLASQLGNIHFDVIGEEHTRQRPAVFFINHQSTLIDALVTSRVVQRGFTVVAKAEVKQIPVLGQLFSLADVAFVERSDTSKAVSALQPAVDRLRKGVSIAISPEGTRSFSPKIGAFKKGGFHMARDAGVPIIPIVIRNAGEIMWRNAKVAQEGTIEVVVHEPLPTQDWTKADLDEWVPRMRQLYIDTLDDWPGTEAGISWSAAIAAASRTAAPK